MANPERVVSRKRTLQPVGWRFRFTDPATARVTHRVFWHAQKRDAHAAFLAYLAGRERLRIGLPGTDGWTMPYATLCQRFVEGFPFSSETQRAWVKRCLALNPLKLVVAADLNDTARLTAAALACAAARARADTRHAGDVAMNHAQHFVRFYVQRLLKQLSRWAAQERLLPADPLAAWRPLPWAQATAARAFAPLELAEILDAAEIIYGHPKYAIISEIGLVHACDYQITLPNTNTMLEAICAQIGAFISTTHMLQYAATGISGSGVLTPK